MDLVDVQYDNEKGKWDLFFEDDQGRKVLEVHLVNSDMGYLVERVLKIRRKEGKKRLQ